jgi:hypothetical protein
MVTEPQLRSLGFKKHTDKNWYLGYWDYKYEISTKILYDINDGFGEPQEITKIKNYEHFKQVIELLGYGE